VVICNCLPFSPDCNSTDPNEIINMSGTTVNPVTIPVVFLSYNKCLEIYASMATGDVEMCLGAPGPAPCERTIAIDACAFVCDPTGGVEYCDNPCYAEYEPNPAPDDIANGDLCVTALGCADNPDTACVTTQACDDGDECTENDEVTVITATGEECNCSGTPVATCVSIDITDPCTCNADENVDLDGDGINDLFYEVITTYTVAFYLADGDSYTANFTSASAGYDLTISGGGCEPCPLVPTLSQWGLIVLCLLLMSFGAIQLTRTRKTYFIK